MSMLTDALFVEFANNLFKWRIRWIWSAPIFTFLDRRLRPMTILIVGRRGGEVGGRGGEVGDMKLFCRRFAANPSRKKILRKCENVEEEKNRIVNVAVGGEKEDCIDDEECGGGEFESNRVSNKEIGEPVQGNHLGEEDEWHQIASLYKEWKRGRRKETWRMLA